MVQVQDPLGNGQAQALAFVQVGIEPVKYLENFGLMFLRDPSAVVRHAKYHPAFAVLFRGDFHGQRAIRVAVLDGIIQQVGKTWLICTASPTACGRESTVMSAWIDCT